MMTLLNTSFEKTLTILLRCITFPLHSIKLCAFFRRKMPHFDQIMPIQLMQTMLYISIATSCVDNWCSHFSHAIRHFRMCHSIGIFTQLTKSCCQFLSILIYLFGIVGMQFRNRNNMCALCKQCEIYLSESAKKKKYCSHEKGPTPRLSSEHQYWESIPMNQYTITCESHLFMYLHFLWLPLPLWALQSFCMSIGLISIFALRINLLVNLVPFCIVRLFRD